MSGNIIKVNEMEFYVGNSKTAQVIILLEEIGRAENREAKEFMKKIKAKRKLAKKIIHE